MLETLPLKSARATPLAYFRLTKPRIVELLLVTTVPTMMLAAGGWPGTWLVAATVIGGTLSAGGANVLNNVCDRDIDQLMKRTAGRPLPAQEIPAGHATMFGVALGVGGYLWLALLVGQLAALLATASLLFYVLVYTLVLKRRTVHNIVIGGAAGAVPVLVGWAAVTGGLSAEAWLLFGVVCLWTPPHFWALAIQYRDDYQRAGVPMLPVVSGIRSTVLQIRLYTVATVVASLLLALSPTVSLLYVVLVAAIGVWFLVGAVRLTETRAMEFFHLSISYLTAIFAIVAVDSLWVG